MTDYKTIKQLHSLEKTSNADFTSVFILKRKSVKTTKTGNPYLNLEFGDSTGKFMTNVFVNSTAYMTLEDLSEGSLLKTTAAINYYNGQFSPEIKTVSLYSFDQASQDGTIGQLTEVPPESESVLWGYLKEGIESIQHAELKATVENVIHNHEAHFKSASAAISMHHAYRSGLLEHTVHMLRSARALLPIYQEVDYDLVVSGIILHDIGKLEEYEGDFSVQTTRIGVLQGHVVLGYKIVRKAAIMAKLSEDLTERLEHIILSHQGEKEWGAAAMAATPEAVFVSMVDNLDARMGMIQRTLRNAPEGAEFSEYLPGLKTKLLLTPPQK